MPACCSTSGTYWALANKTTALSSCIAADAHPQGFQRLAGNSLWQPAMFQGQVWWTGWSMLPWMQLACSMVSVVSTPKMMGTSHSKLADRVPPAAALATAS